MDATVTVDHTTTLTTSSDANLLCTACGQVWRVFPRALPQPYALPIEPPSPARPTYVVAGNPVDLTTSLDDGRVLTVTTSWPCTCGAVQTYDTPTTERIECECGRVALRRNPPADFHINPRYGQACSCCGRDGVHVVARAFMADWQCRRTW